MPERTRMDDIDKLIDDLDDGSDVVFVAESVQKENEETLGKHVPEELLKTDSKRGLTNAEVSKRSKVYGDNQLSEQKEKNFFQKILLYFVGPVQYVMIAAALLAAGLQHWIELGVIVALLMLNAGVGYIQEYKAGSVVAELSKSVASRTIVVRNSQTFEIPAIEV